MTDRARSEIRSSNQVRSYYDSRVPALSQEYAAYRWSASPLKREHYRQTRDRISAALRGRKFGRVAEVGSGPLIWTSLIRAHASSVIALDLSLEMLKAAASERDQALRCCADVARLPLSNEMVDAVCTFRAFEYFPDKAAALREVARVLRPGGALVLLTKNRNYRGYAARRSGVTRSAEQEAVHSGNCVAEEVVVLCEGAGFTDITVRPAIVGRTRFIPLWRLGAWLGRFKLAGGRRRLPAWIDGATESFLVTATRA